MTIYLNKDSKIIVQGITGGMGSKHTTLMLQADADIVGGVNARKAGTTVELNGKELPVFGTVEEAMKETGANVSVAFVPPAFTKDACIEAILGNNVRAAQLMGIDPSHPRASRRGGLLTLAHELAHELGLDDNPGAGELTIMDKGIDTLPKGIGFTGGEMIQAQRRAELV